MREGFRIDKVGSMTDSGWYGAGIYFSEKTGYSQNYDKAGKLLLCQLLIGNPKQLRHDQRCDAKKTPYGGYTSHIVNDGDEIVMFDTDAILPTYIIHYR